MAISIQTGYPAVEPFRHALSAIFFKKTLLIHGYTQEQIQNGTGGPKDISFMYTKTTFTRSFNTSEIHLLEEYEATLSEGPGHSGKSSMIDFVGKL